MTSQSNILRKYIDILNEGPPAGVGPNAPIKVPPIPALPKTDGELPGGEKTQTNPDGTRTYAGAFGRFTYDKSGKAIKYASPQLTSVGREVDLTSGDLTTNYNDGPMSVSQTQTPGGYTKQTDKQYDLGTATVGQQIKNPTVGSSQLAGTTTNTVTDKGTGQTKQQVKGVAFGGASGANVGKNYVGSSEDELAQHAANSVTGGQPPATTVKEEFNLSKSLNEGPPPGVGPNAAPKKQSAPTMQQRADQLAAADAQTGQGMSDIEKGNYASGAVGVAKGVNQMANAAGLSFMDKLKMGWMFAKAGVRGLITGLKAGDAGAGANAAAASLIGEVIPEVHKYVNSPNFAKEFEAGVMKMKDSPDPKNKEMYQKYMSGELTANSFKAYVNRQYDDYLKMQKGQNASGDVDDNMYTTPSAPMNTSNYSAQTPTPAEGIQYKNKSLLEHIEEIENEGSLSSGDYFHIELAEDEGIETWVIAEWSESVLIEADKDTLKLLEEHGCTFHDELTEAEYQGRSVPLGKRMAGDVKKSKVYVKKPNGKVVKVNFGDKNMTIKKSNPKRRKSFRARHNCANPGPRWKARYWSCRAW